MYKASIKLRVVFSLLLVILGGVIIILNILDQISFQDEFKDLVNISGTLVSSVCAFPIKEIIDRKNKIKLIQGLTSELYNLTGKDKKKLEELLWKFIEKNTLD